LFIDWFLSYSKTHLQLNSLAYMVSNVGMTE